MTLEIVNMDGFTPKAGARRTLFGSHA
jgi:hypothetical protein